MFVVRSSSSSSCSCCCCCRCCRCCVVVVVAVVVVVVVVVVAVAVVMFICVCLLLPSSTSNVLRTGKTAGAPSGNGQSLQHKTAWPEREEAPAPGPPTSQSEAWADQGGGRVN